MAWSVVENGGDCSGDTPWAVMNSETDASEGCFATEEEAQAEVDRLQAAADAADGGGDMAADPAEGAMPERFSLMLVPEGEMTTDGREIAPGSLSIRALPLPFMLLTENSAWGHEGARIAGAIDELSLVDGEWIGAGRFDTGGEAGLEAQRLVFSQMIRWVSVDLEVTAAEYVLVDAEGNDSEIELEDLWEIPDGYRVIERVTEGRIMGGTACPFPAFPTAVVVPEGTDLGAASENGREAAAYLRSIAASARIAEGLVASAARPECPPAAWFEDPHLTEPTPITIGDDGRVYGHVADWQTCHTGRPGVCLTAPSSPSGYAYFRTGSIRTGEGNEVPVGQLTFATGHAQTNLSSGDAAAHYDHTGTAWADVAAGEDEHGIWIAGITRPGLTDEQLRVLRASAVSGDWRRIGTGLEMVAVLSVNVPGFPIPRTQASVREQRQLSLVAAGVIRNDPLEDRFEAIERQLAEQRGEFMRMIEPLVPMIAEQLGARVASLVART